MSKGLRVAAVAVVIACAATPSWAQTRAARDGEVESDPIRCWWKAEKTAIRVGERFQVVLTCGVIETAGITVVPAVNQLEAGAISLPPFEAVSGERRDDVVVAPWRYLQYEYTMRLLTEGFFGQDVSIPPLTVTYNIQAAGGASDRSGPAGAAGALMGEGRDQTYTLPALPIRVLSVVPQAAADIRDASGETFAAVESRRFRASMATVTAALAFALAAVLAVLAIVRAAGTFRARDPEAVRPVPAPALLRGCLRRLGQVRAEAARTGWTPELTGRALAALRIAGALALGRTVAQQYVDADATERPGQVAVRTGLLRRQRALLSAATTPVAIASGLEGRTVRGAQARANLERIAEAMRVFAAASYGRSRGEADAATLNSALEDVLPAIRRLRLNAFWPMRTAQAVARSVLGA